MFARWSTLGIWALVAAAAFYWGLKLFVQVPAAPAQTVVVETGNGARGDLSRLLGAEPVLVAQAAPPEPVADERFQLLGVVSPRQSSAAREGLALIAVDGKAAKAYRVGAVVDGNTVLLAVRARGASLGPRGGEANVALEIAPPAPAAVGTLPPALEGQPQMARPPVMMAPQPGMGAMPGAIPGAIPGAMPGAIPGAIPGAVNRSRPLMQPRLPLPTQPQAMPGRAGMGDRLPGNEAVQTQ